MRTWLIFSVVIMMAAISFAQVPSSNHVVMVVEENHSYSSVIGNSAMPYLNSLASKYGLATQYYANAHPSIGNYFALTTGQLLTKDDTMTPARFPVSADNIVRQLMVAGKTWKSYAEGLPSEGYTGGNTGPYAVRRNPFAFFTDVQNSSTQKSNLVPFSQFATDLANNQLPNFSYVIPNVVNSGRSGTPQQADAWLKQNIAPLLANEAFQQDGLLIITFDESASTDTANGGGRVATLVIGPKTVLGHKSTTLYQHPSLLRTVLTSLGASTFPGAANTAPSMTEFFSTSATAQAATARTANALATGVTISSPAAGATVSSPVNVVASAASGSTTAPITAMRIYIDSQDMYTVNAATISKSLALANGAHNLTVVAWDSTGKSYTSSRSFTVGAAPTTAAGVTIASPANGATVSSPVQFVASAQPSAGKAITAMRIYVDNASVYLTNSASLNTSVSMAAGAHYVVVQAWDSGGAIYKTARNITVGSTTTKGTLGVSASAVNFGSVNLGTAATRTVTATAGTASVTISQAAVSAGYTVSGPTLPVTLAAGQSATFTVRFAPTAAGTVSGSLALASNASNSTASVGLTGTGTAVATTVPHAVALNWNASTSTGVGSYNVYRGSQSAGPFTKLTNMPATGRTYTDSSVSGGATYYYVVTAVSTSGAESSYSTPAKATVPTP